MDIERGNRLVKMKSWADWLAPNNERVCLTLNCYSLNGTDIKIGDDVLALLNNLSESELKTLTVEMVVGLNEYCFSVHRLSGFGMGLILDRARAEIAVAFVTNTKFEDFRQNRIELNMFVGEKKHNDPISPVQDETESESLDSMDSARYYVERLQDYFDGF